MNLLGRLVKIVNWVLFGEMGSRKRSKLKVVLASVVKLLEAVKESAKDIEVVANKSGEMIIRFKKEF